MLFVKNLVVLKIKLTMNLLDNVNQYVEKDNFMIINTIHADIVLQK